MLITVHYCKSSCEVTWKLQSTELMENTLLEGFLGGGALKDKVRVSVEADLSKVELFDSTCLVQ